MFAAPLAGLGGIRSIDAAWGCARARKGAGNPDRDSILTALCRLRRADEAREAVRRDLSPRWDAEASRAWRGGCRDGLSARRCSSVEPAAHEAHEPPQGSRQFLNNP